MSIPIHNIYLSSNLVNGPVAMGVKPSLPFDGIHLLLGNDLAGNRVKVDPLVTKKPCVNWKPDPVENNIPGLYLACAVTRSMSTEVQSSQDDSKETNLEDTGAISEDIDTDIYVQ